MELAITSSAQNDQKDDIDIKTTPLSSNRVCKTTMRPNQLRPSGPRPGHQPTFLPSRQRAPSIPLARLSQPRIFFSGPVTKPRPVISLKAGPLKPRPLSISFQKPFEPFRPKPKPSSDPRPVKNSANSPKIAKKKWEFDLSSESEGVLPAETGSVLRSLEDQLEFKNFISATIRKDKKISLAPASIDRLSSKLSGEIFRSFYLRRRRFVLAPPIDIRPLSSRLVPVVKRRPPLANSAGPRPVSGLHSLRVSRQSGF